MLITLNQRGFSMMLRKRLFVLFLSLTFIIQPFHFSLNRKAQTETDEWISFKYARVFADNPIGSEVEAISKNLDASMINDLMEKDADAYVRSYYMFNQKRGTSENRNALCNDGGAQEIQPIILNLKNKKIVSLAKK